jgi:hypothetical protein
MLAERHFGEQGGGAGFMLRLLLVTPAKAGVNA